MSSNFFSSRGRELLAGRTDNGLLVVISRGQNETTSAVQLPSELVHRCRLVRHEYQRVNAYHRIGRFVLEPFSSNEPTRNSACIIIADPLWRAASSPAWAISSPTRRAPAEVAIHSPFPPRPQLTSTSRSPGPTRSSCPLQLSHCDEADVRGTYPIYPRCQALPACPCRAHASRNLGRSERPIVKISAVLISSDGNKLGRGDAVHAAHPMRVVAFPYSGSRGLRKEA